MVDFLNKLLRAGEGRLLRRLELVAEETNAWEPTVEQLGDDALRGKTAEFRARLDEGEELDDMLPEAFACVREAAKRSLGMRHFDVQLVGGAVLNEGAIAEMKTGEGKTLVATLPLYLNALLGDGAHLVTVNDYLARRDAEWMRPVYEALGMTVGIIEAQMEPQARKAAYECDITYGTNSEFGFDYLRDNLATEIDETVQRPHTFAIVDEVDSILVDEARTPLIIAGQPEEAADIYYTFAKIVKGLTPGDDFEVDEKRKTAAPTESGVAKVEQGLGVENLYAPGSSQMVNHLIQALKAESLYSNGVEYLVVDGEVKIVDEFTGRIMEGRRWSEGLHQAVEAKEGVKIEAENVTVATVTIQNYFRLYDKLAGMTGTALTEANEFHEIYGLEVVPIPTNVPVTRIDRNDLIYKTEDEKFRAVVNDIAERNAEGQPVLVGTISVEVSERVAALLERKGIQHNVLNARTGQEGQEAQIIKDAGTRGAVTIATNMAGRGVDIKLGDGVTDLGGLYVIGTERHESRRIDNQLRGRSGRQGDPGETRFFLSAEDQLVRLFAGDRIFTILDKLGPGEDEPIEHKMLTKRIEGAQKRVEEMHFDMRKQVLKYDDVLNKQREVIYAERRGVLEGDDLSESILEWIDDVVDDIVTAHAESNFPEEWDLEGLLAGYHQVTAVTMTAEELGPTAELEREELITRLIADAHLAYERKEKELSETPGLDDDIMRQLERFFLLQVIDAHWREHLDSMDYLREGIHLRSMAQKDPLVEYRVEGHAMFEEMMAGVREEVVSMLFHVEVTAQDAELERPDSGQLIYDDGGSDVASGAYGGGSSTSTYTPAGTGGSSTSTSAPRATAASNGAEAIGRNDPCPCGSGKKYKRCHGQAA
ncbi:MAG TPA: preprotein translocase subunit SecA [Gaiellales bacterium]